MYQPPRPSGRATGSAASSPRTNPLRSNNDRDKQSETRRLSSDPASSLNRGAGDSSSELGSSQSMGDRQEEQAREAQKLNQIIQQFFVKGALTIVSSRMTFPKSFSKSGAVRENKWFNLRLEDSDELSGLTADWRMLRMEDGIPPPLTIEIYLDLSELTRSQSLVIIDEDGKRWNVEDALNHSTSSSARPNIGRITDLVLERWEFSMDRSTSSSDGDTLSNVYKRCIPVFRSLYCHSRLLPAYKYCRRNTMQPANNASNSALKPKYRILSGRPPVSISLNIPLHPNPGIVTAHYDFGQLRCPAGMLQTSVTYRTSCDFRVDDSEAILSSHFMVLDDHYFKPSLAGRTTESHMPGSAPAKGKDYLQEAGDNNQTYGSMSTFHNTDLRSGTSPMSALRANADRGSDTPPQKVPPRPRMAQESKSSLRSNEASPYQRRTSVSFQPFKAGSLASSPGAHIGPSPGSSVGRPSNLGPFSHRSRSSLTTLPQVVLRTPNLANETAVASSASSSPKPAPISNRYSSSFSHRRSRFSSGGASKGDDDNSSGRGSAASSAQPGSEVMNEGRADGSASGSAQQTDDENLKDFIRFLEQKKDLKSFSRSDSAARDATMRRTTAALSKFQNMRDTNAQLSDSMSSSLLLHRSSTSSSRQLSSVPAMIAGTSASTGSSPGKPISPHTPHTPAVPSRLSANSIIDYGDPSRPRRSQSRVRSRGQETEAAREEDSSDTTTRTETGTTAIDIPRSPRAWTYGTRSSSVNQRQNRVEEEEPEFVLRSASLPVDERVDLSLSELRGLESAAPQMENSNQEEGKAGESASSEEQSPATSGLEAPRRAYSATPGAPALPHRLRLSRNSLSLRGSPMFLNSYSPSGSAQGPSSATERFTPNEHGGVGARNSPSSRNSVAQDDDEGFIFAMSEIGATGSRRSGEEPRGGADRRAGRGAGNSSNWRG